MYQCFIENEYNEKLELTNNPNYRIYQIDGLEPPTATINTSALANFDGELFNSSKANKRNIVIYMSIEGDCEENRINLYKYVRSKRFIRFYYKNSHRDVYIDGYVESIQIAFFEKKQTVQISIICPSPWFKAVLTSIVEFSTITSLFTFPFAYDEAGGAFSSVVYGAQKNIINNGDISNGILITMKASGDVVNPAIYNFSNNTYIELTMTLAEGDELIINTNASNKKIKLIHNGVTQDKLSAMNIGSTWFQLRSGDNLFSYDAETSPENLSCVFTHVDEFEGV